MVFLSRIEVWASLIGLAGFLALFWMIRGAPVGQKTRPEPDEAPGPLLIVVCPDWPASLV